ncbi:hypothetical protein NGB36_14090 [Streptomyces sp. RB6PN25]|uniref:Chaplin domain-containing protein n=1 Tax=Streptomyces humicola TaxID=2953240 RepID=A0ABT1PVK8_9ACTN|nr:hypothetical protein [Streptomyces humicola]MCQ4081707.1 hypothetical protein [Streptomyces humicola]
MTDRTRADRRPQAARLLAVCAVLVGLFLMHGAPSGAAGGCHGSMPVATMPMANMAHMAPVAHLSHAVAVHDEQAPRLSPAGVHGGSCVSTPAHDPVPVGAAGLSAVVTAAGWAVFGRRPGSGGVRWRGPPMGGRSLLSRVCVART